LIEDFGSWIKEKRGVNNVSQSRLAELSGISKGYIGYIETQSNPPSRKMCVKLAGGLFLSETEVLTNAGFYPPGTDIYLDKEELDLIRKYRELDATTKRVVKGMINGAYQDR
jgi:transcriptional regulator with XRE-family HTH domain